MNEDYTGAEAGTDTITLRMRNLDLNTEAGYDTVGTADDILDLLKETHLERLTNNVGTHFYNEVKKN